jgi:hypothetical protein
MKTQRENHALGKNFAYRYRAQADLAPALQPIASTGHAVSLKSIRRHRGSTTHSAALAGLIDEHLQGRMRRSPRATPKTTGCTGGNPCHS